MRSALSSTLAFACVSPADAGLELFVDPSCEYTTLGDWNDWGSPGGLGPDELACLCAVNGRAEN